MSAVESMEPAPEKLTDPQMCEAYVADIYQYLHKMEKEVKRSPMSDYIEKVQKDVSVNMRAVLVDWLVEVAEEYKLLSDTLYLTISYIDKFLSINVLNRQKLQLLGVSSMLIAANAKGEGCVFNVELTDEDGTQIQATIKQFKTVQNDYSMTLNEYSQVEEAVNEAVYIPETKFNLVPIDELGPYTTQKELIDVIDVVQSVSPTMSIRRKIDNQTIPKRDIVIADNTSVYYGATDVFILRFMIEACWAPMLGAFSVPIDQSDDVKVIGQCLEGFRHAIHVTAAMSMKTHRDAFVTSLEKFSSLHSPSDIKKRNIDAIKEHCLQRLQNRLDIAYDSSIPGHHVRFIIMGNLFCSNYTIHRRFDLKGSSPGRLTDKPESEIEATTILKDLDLKFFFRLQKTRIQEFRRQIVRDCDFLEQERIMDYSLLVGLNFREPSNIIPIGDL